MFGKNIIITDNTDWTPREIVEASLYRWQVEDRFRLTKNDDLILICDDDPNDNNTSKIKYLFEHDRIFVNIINIKRLQFNILEHEIVPKSRVLNDEEVNNLKIQYNLKHLKELPELSRFDPQAQAMCLRPGQVCEFQRKSVSAITTNYYRICV